MDPNLILQAISSVGFPIVVAAALFWKMNKQDQDHKEEMQKVTEAVNNNTLALQKLVDKWEVKQYEDKQSRCGAD